MLDELYVVIAGLEMHGRPGIGPYVILKDGVDGWDDGVPMRGEKTPRPQSHGALILPRYQESRTPTFRGMILADSHEEREILKNRLSGLLADGSFGRVQVTKGGITTWAEAAKDTSNIDDVHGTTHADFQIQLWCPDARRFGETRKFVASVGSPIGGVHHRGNAAATPKLDVAGNMPGGYTLTLKGKVFNITAPLVPGVPHNIDYDDGRLRIDGEIVHGGVGYGFTPLVTPGVPTALAIEPGTTGTATATLTLVDTYI